MNQEIEQLEVTSSNSEWNKNSNKKKIKIDKKTMIVLAVVSVIAIVIFIAANNSVKPNNQFLNEDGSVAIETGTKWGDAYANYVYQEMGEMSKYDVSFVDLNNDDIPEMLFKYLDNDEKDTLKILYLYRDEVLVTKTYHNYSLYLLYSVKEKNTGWYIYINNGNNYGAYTSLAKIVNGTVKDSDIKARTDKEVEAYKRAYVDGKYSLTFYEIKMDNFIEDFTTVVGRYDAYKSKIEDASTNLINDNSDLTYEEIIESNLSDTEDSFVINGYRLKYGNYYSSDGGVEQPIMEVTKDKTIIFYGKTYSFSTSTRTFIISVDDFIEIKGNNTLSYNNVLYKYNEIDYSDES